MSFDIRKAAQAAKRAAVSVANLSREQKDAVLLTIAAHLREQTDVIVVANQKDMQAGESSGLDAAMLDRLLLTPERIDNIAKAVEHIAGLPDPVGELSTADTMPSGISVAKMRIPLGVIGMIYESRPNVTVDAAALCFKAGNAVILRGGKEALHSNLALAACIHSALSAHDVPSDAVVVVPDPSRDIMNTLMTLNDSIDLLIPRGGEGLIRFVSENSRIPVIQHYKGVCHLYVDAQADLHNALALAENGKTQRTGVCNALETLLVHQSAADSFMPMVAAMFASHGVKVHACPRSISYFDNADQATAQDWDAEYLALEIAVKIVDSLDEAIGHIQEFGSGHTEVIATENINTAQQFVRRVNSAVVMVNASSRFSDGGELGLGAEIGISTSKLHAYGPMGLASLTTEKFVVTGQGQVRT